MLSILTNLFKDSEHLQKNFLARRWGPAKVRMFLDELYILRSWYLYGYDIDISFI